MDYQQFAETTKAFYVGEEGFNRFCRLYGELFGRRDYFIIADDNTKKAAGDRLDKCLTREGLTRAGAYVYRGKPTLEADYSHVTPLKEKLTEAADAVPVAVGSGTINDLVKAACGELNRPYGVFATAASVDGYASDGAALVKGGYKQTLRCPAPVLIVADSGVLERAPRDMTAAGYADLIAKIPAGADWLVADILGEDPLVPEVWDFIQKPLRGWTALPVNRDRLYEGLTATGFAMQHLKKSRPASGAEHLISHIWEMEHLTHKGRSFSHGFKVGMGSLIMTGLAEGFIALEPEGSLGEEALAGYRPLEERLVQVQSAFKEPLLSQIREVVKEKTLSPDAHEARVRLILEKWEEIRAALAKQLIPLGELKTLLREAGCPVEPSEMGLTPEKIGETVRKAQMIRNRYTLLDLVDDLNLWNRFFPV